MRTIVIICCFLLTLSAFSQQKEDKRDAINVPASIFTLNIFNIQQLNNQRITDNLNLTGFKFMVVDHNIPTDIRNIGRKISIEDLMDNYQKSELNKYFFKGYNMWDISLQQLNNQVHN